MANEVPIPDGQCEDGGDRYPYYRGAGMVTAEVVDAFMEVSKNTGLWYVRVIMEALESTNSTVPAGSRFQQFISLDPAPKKKLYWLRDLGKLFAGILNVQPRHISTKVVEGLIASKDTMLIGRKVLIQSTTRPYVNDKKEEKLATDQLFVAKSERHPAFDGM
jgi:hypothetical protein